MTVQGTLALLVLKTLARGPLHGYASPPHIQMVSKDILRVEEGSLYPALHRMEQDSWSAGWGISGTIAALATIRERQSGNNLPKKERTGSGSRKPSPRSGSSPEKTPKGRYHRCVFGSRA